MHNLLQADFGYSLQLLFCSVPLYQHNNLYTKNSLNHIYILNLHAYQISLVSFFPWEIPWIVLYLNMAEYLPAYVYGQDMLLLLLLLLPFVHTIFGAFLLYHVLIDHISLFSCVLVQTLYGIDICILNVLCFLLFFNIVKNPWFYAICVQVL